MTELNNDWFLWEVFIRSADGMEHRHCGSVHAPDAELALNNARDVYTRRKEGVSIWVAKSADIAASDPAEKERMFESGNDKIYRHPAFYKMPDNIGHI